MAEGPFDKFMLPAKAITVHKRTVDELTLNMQDLIEIGRQRVWAGEDLNDVAGDLAEWDVAFSAEGQEMHENTNPRALSAARPPSELAMQSAADEHYKKGLKVAQLALRAGQNAVSKSALRGALMKKDSNAVARAMAPAVLATEETLQRLLEPLLLQALRAGGDTGVRLLNRHLRSLGLRVLAQSYTSMHFDMQNPEVIKWAKKHSAKTITNISKTTRKRIADSIIKALEMDLSLDDMYDVILGAIGDDARATNIARTELMTAANEGQRAAWRQSVDEGLLTGKEKRVWIATVGACPLCDGLDGQTAPLDGEYPDPGGEGPPLHNQCRCTEGITY